MSGAAQPGATPTQYAGGVAIAYAENGGIYTLNRGDQLVDSWRYSPDRMLPTSISIGSAAARTSTFGTSLYYCPNKVASCATNNGNLVTASLSVLSVDQNFGYDHLNRLTSAGEGANNSAWSQTYDHDAYGNHWTVGGTGTFTPTSAGNFNLKNQLVIQGSDYDAAGNQKVIGGSPLFGMRKGEWCRARLRGRLPTRTMAMVAA